MYMGFFKHCVTLWLEKMYKQKMYKISTKKHITQD